MYNRRQESSVVNSTSRSTKTTHHHPSLPLPTHNTPFSHLVSKVRIECVWNSFQRMHNGKLFEDDSDYERINCFRTQVTWLWRNGLCHCLIYRLWIYFGPKVKWKIRGEKERNKEKKNEVRTEKNQRKIKQANKYVNKESKKINK